MNMRKIGLSVVFLFALLNTFGQDDKGNEIFSTMRQALDKNFKELEIEGEKPFFMEYMLMTRQAWNVNASQGTILNKKDGEKLNAVALRLLLGSQELSSSVSSRPLFYVNTLPQDFTPEDVQNAFAQSSDYALEKEHENYKKKLEALAKHPRDPRKDPMRDFSSVPEVTTTLLSVPAMDFEMGYWEKAACELSSIFSGFPRLFDSYVNVYALRSIIYKVTSEGMTLRQPLTYVHVVARATVETKDACLIEDQCAIMVPLLEDLPSVDSLREEITRFARRLDSYADGIAIEEPYEGPVLYEDEALQAFWQFNTVASGASGRLLSGRSIFDDSRSEWFGKMNQRVLDADITVWHCPSMREYKGEKLFGCYDMDAEGVKPADKLLLMENGVIKARLNDRMPDMEDPVSTGSARFKIKPDNIEMNTAPGVIHILAQKTMRDGEMKAELLKSAREQGLPFAYIIRREQRGRRYAGQVYRVDVNTGEEMIVTNAKVKSIFNLKGDNILGFSDKERIDNCFLDNVCLLLLC